MNENEIIKGLLIGLDEIEIDVLKLSKKIGYKNYKKFEVARQEAYKLQE